MGSRMKQVSVVLVASLVILVLLVYLKRRSDALGVARVCSSQSLKTDMQTPFQNGYLEIHKCCDAMKGKPLEEMCKYDGKSDPPDNVGVPGCNCMDYFYCKLVVVSSVSSNHLSEATEMIVSVQRYMPSTRLIMYSLGLTSGEMELLRSYCNVEVRIFDFDKYPTLAYSKNHLRTFGWKPVVVKEVSEQYEVVMYFDSSVRLNGPITEKVLKYLWSSPAFIAGPWIGNGCYKSNKPIVSFTHNAMLQYLFPNTSKSIPGLRKELAIWGHLQAGCWLMWLNSDMRKRLLANWVDCALHEECMAPKAANIDGCTANLVFSNYAPQGKYIGCHRYDQSALNLIFYREFGPTSAQTICHRFVFNLLAVQRQTNLFFYIFVLVISIVIVIIFFINWYCNSN